jgi:predicted nucleic acid-binding protein
LTDEDHKRILKLSIRRKISFYDAVYVFASKIMVWRCSRG